jgi:hypothetical protein
MSSWLSLLRDSPRVEETVVEAHTISIKLARRLLEDVHSEGVLLIEDVFLMAIIFVLGLLFFIIIVLLAIVGHLHSVMILEHALVLFVGVPSKLLLLLALFLHLLIFIFTFFLCAFLLDPIKCALGFLFFIPHFLDAIGILSEGKGMHGGVFLDQDDSIVVVLIH